MATTAYWGGAEMVSVHAKCLMRLGQERMIGRGGGVVLNSAFRAFPVMVSLYAAGLGYVAAGDFVPAASLLTQSQIHDFNGPRQVLIEFTHSIGDIHSILKSVPKLQNTKVPFSELM